MGAGAQLIPFHHFGTRTIPARPIGQEIGRASQEEIASIAFKRIREAFAKGLKEGK